MGACQSAVLAELIAAWQTSGDWPKSLTLTPFQFPL